LSLQRRSVVARLRGGVIVPPSRHVALRTASHRKGDEPEH
jgi:hypothetical protein